MFILNRVFVSLNQNIHNANYKLGVKNPISVIFVVRFLHTQE